MKSLSFILLATLLTLQITSAFGEENSAYVESSEFRKSKEQLDSNDNKAAATGQVVLRRRVVRKKMSPATTTESLQEETPQTEKANTRRPLFAARNQRPPLKTTLKQQIGKIQEASTKKKFQPMNKKRTTTTTTTTAEPEVVETSTEESSAEEDRKNNSSMIIIPVPPSQRKPYHPVIMQVTKAPPTETARVVTYKLNKMFVPMGIYGKVLSNYSEADVEAESSLLSTPMPFLMPGQEPGRNSSGEVVVRHKGTESKEVNESGKWENLLKEIKAKNSKTRKSKDHSRIADTIDITYNYRPDVNKISLTTPRMDIASISLTTEQPMRASADLHSSSSDNRKQWTNHYHNNGRDQMTMLHPPAVTTTDAPQKKVSFGASTFVESIKDAASNIPSLFHKGITSLSSLTTALSSENPFHDETFSASEPVHSSILAAVPGGFVSMPSQMTTTTVSPAEAEYETLEYFRNRPHLINKAGRKHFREPSYFSSGFRPVTAPSFMAKDYYASTTTNTPKNHNRGRDEETSASSSSWKIVDPGNRESKMMPTEEDTSSSWRTIFQAKEYGTKGAEASSWRSFFGLGPQTEHGTNYNSAMLEGGRRREMVLDRKWEEMRRKYSKKELAEAKERLFEIVSSDSSPHDVYATIPARASNALRDLFNMFKFGINFSSGKSTSPVLHFDNLKDTHSSASSSHFGDSSWRPLSKAGGTPLITFSAGITFKGGNISPTTSNLLRGGSHFSSSSRPFTPYKYNGHKHHLVDLSHSYVTKATPAIVSHDVGIDSYGSELPASSYYTTASSPLVVESPVEQVGSEYSSGGEYSAVDAAHSPGGEYSAVDAAHSSDSEYSPSSYSAATPYSPSSYNPSSYSAAASYSPSSYRHAVLSATKSNSNYEAEAEDAAAEGSSAYELVPSDVFFSQKNPDMSNIAAVIKPSDISDDLVKAHLPQEISGVPTLDFPTRQLPKHAPQKFSSLSQLQNYLATAEPKPTAKIPLQYQYQQQLPQRPQPAQVTPQAFQQLQYQQVQNLMHYQQPIAQFQPQQQPFQFNSFGSPVTHQTNNKIKTTGDKTVGFSDFELPANIDPDIASLLKSELDKDDIPEEFRQDFEDAKKEEAAKKKPAIQQQQQQHQSARRNDNVNPFLVQRPQQQQQSLFGRYPQRQFNLLTSPLNSYNFHGNHFNANRLVQQPQPQPPFGGPSVSLKPVSKFHAPMPISPTMMTSQSLWRSRYNSPVPRYVIELAKKLQKDKDVQGIVRVSTKRGRGPPIEYLYPVRG